MLVKSVYAYLVVVLSVLLFSCNKEEVISNNTGNSFELELSGAETDTWIGTATWRAPVSYINQTRLWIVDLETGGVDEPALLLGVTIPDDRTYPDYPSAGTYEAGQLGNSASGRDPFVSVYAVNDPSHTWVDNPGSVTITEASDGVIAGTVTVSIQNNDRGGFTTFEGSFRAVTE